MLKILISFCLLISLNLFSQDTVHLSDYKNIAIATDLEPDDVLALKILFQEANTIFYQNPEEGYPIKLVIVGEGNNAIKKLRMEFMLNNYFNLPENVKINVKAGKSTSDNPFPYDGFELFDKDILKSYLPLAEEGSKALINFIIQAEKPLIIQLKPVQELIGLTSMPELSKKTDIIFYGSFNFRKSLKDQSVADFFNFTHNETLSFKMQTLLDHIGSSFNKVGIVESYGVLGEESSVYFKYEWSNSVASYIENSHDSFYLMFRDLVNNWNKYLFEKQVIDLKLHINKLIKICPNDKEMLNQLSKQLESIKTNPENAFDLIYDEINLMANSLQYDSQEVRSVLDKLQRDLEFANRIKPSIGIQFTLSDIIVALVLSDRSSFFSMSPVKIQINNQGFIQISPHSQSNIFYYDRKGREDFVKILLSKLTSI